MLLNGICEWDDESYSVDPEEHACAQVALNLLWSCRTDRAVALAGRSGVGVAGVREPRSPHCSLRACCFGLVGQTGQQRLLAAAGWELQVSGGRLRLPHCSVLACCFGLVGQTGQMRLLAAAG